MPTLSIPALRPPAPDAFFDAWLSAARAAPHPIAEATAEPMRRVWLMWCRHLAGAGPAAASSWDLATAEDVDGFLSSLSSPPCRARPAGGRASAQTRYRYARLLDRLYAFALIHGHVELNPVQGLHRRDRPGWTSDSASVLLPALWYALPEFFPEPEGSATVDAGDDALASRDRAVLGLLYDLALTPQEIRVMEPGHLVVAAGGAWSLVIDGADKTLPRTLAIEQPDLIEALEDWRRRREAAIELRSSPFLFVTRRGEGLSKQILHNLVGKFIESACAGLELPLPPRIGPQTLRNTAIASWLAKGQEPQEVLQRLGLKDPRTLAKLPGAPN